MHLKTVAAVFFVVANAMNQANAQAPTPTPEVLILPATPQTLESALPDMKRGHKLIIVTSKDPTVKRTCHFDSVTADEIRCQRPLHTQPEIYRKADLDTIIEPASSHFYWVNFAVFFALGGGIITGACFLGAISALAIIGAVPIAMIGGFYVLASVVMSRDDYKSATVLYQKPGTTLAVKLR
ncbi:MAG TPA: hypothetical protein VFC39_21045 [Acidobacteriaceae bacterium]|nr:hypothetical protein [Acidobacteriaceae bacterium]